MMTHLVTGLLMTFLPVLLLLPSYAADGTKNKVEKPVFVNSITISGLNYTHEHIVRRELFTKEGQVYDPGAWNYEKNSFDSLGIFADSSLNVYKMENGVDLAYSFKELPPYILFPSFKITDQNGFMTGPAFAFLNLFGEAVRMEFFYRGTVAPEFFKAQEYLFYLSSLWINTIPLEYGLFVVYYDLYNPLKLYNEQSLTISLDLAYRLERVKLLWAGELYRVRHDEKNEVFDAGSSESDIFLSDSDWEYVPKCGAGIAWDTRDRLIDTFNGMYHEVRISQYGGFLGGPANYLELLYDFRFFTSFVDSHIIHVSILGQYRPGRMGAYDYFHVGGPNTLRGYGQDPAFSGQHELLSTIEYRYVLLENQQFKLFDMNVYVGIQLIAGIDTATLWQKNSSFNEGDFYNSYYTGVHILFPGFQRLRLEYGFSGANPNGNAVRFAFTVGFYEKPTVQRWAVR